MMYKIIQTKYGLALLYADEPLATMESVIGYCTKSYWDSFMQFCGRHHLPHPLGLSVPEFKQAIINYNNC